MSLTFNELSAITAGIWIGLILSMLMDALAAAAGTAVFYVLLAIHSERKR